MLVLCPGGVIFDGEELLCQIVYVGVPQSVRLHQAQLPARLPLLRVTVRDPNPLPGLTADCVRQIFPSENGGEDVHGGVANKIVRKRFHTDSTEVKCEVLVFNTQANTGIVELHNFDVLLHTTHIVEEGPADGVTGVLLIINLVQVVRELRQNDFLVLHLLDCHRVLFARKSVRVLGALEKFDHEFPPPPELHCACRDLSGTRKQ